MRTFVTAILTVMALYWQPSSIARAENTACYGQFAQLLNDERNRNAVPLARFISPISELHAITSGKGSLDEKIETLISTDARKHIFRLEALIRIYKNHPEIGAEVLHWESFIKKFEDYLGWYTDNRTKLENAKKLNVPTDALNVLQEHTNEMKNKLKNLLANGGWSSTPPKHTLSEMLNSLQHMKWPKQKEDANYLLKYFDDEINRVSSTNFDMNELQSGVHEWRRQVRWLLLEIQALQGKVQLVSSTDSLNAPLAEVLKDRALVQKHTSYEVGQDIKHHIELPKHLIEAVAVYVKRIGDLKDNGEAIESIQHALLESAQKAGKKLSPEEALKQAEKFVGGTNNMEANLKAAQEIYSHMKSSNVLEELRSKINGQM